MPETHVSISEQRAFSLSPNTWLASLDDSSQEVNTNHFSSFCSGWRSAAQLKQTGFSTAELSPRNLDSAGPVWKGVSEELETKSLIGAAPLCSIRPDTELGPELHTDPYLKELSI